MYVVKTVVAIARKVLACTEAPTSADSPKKGLPPSGGLRQTAGKRLLESKEFVDTLKLLTRVKHPLLLQCVLETLVTIPNM